MDVLVRLKKGELSVPAAQAEIRAINSMLSAAQLAMEHARLSGRLEQGSDVIPDAKLDHAA